jgi:hypothetical protein
MNHDVGDATENVEELGRALAMIEELQNEVMYYRSLFISDLNPTNASIINALRVAADIREDFERFKEDRSVSKLIELCSALERENTELKRMLRDQRQL